jgi:hypothetical protein
MRHTRRKDEADRRDPGRAPLPAEHPELKDEQDSDSAENSLADNPPNRSSPR